MSARGKVRFQAGQRAFFCGHTGHPGDNGSLVTITEARRDSATWADRKDPEYVAKLPSGTRTVRQSDLVATRGQFNPNGHPAQRKEPTAVVEAKPLQAPAPATPPPVARARRFPTIVTASAPVPTTNEDAPRPEPSDGRPVWPQHYRMTIYSR